MQASPVHGCSPPHGEQPGAWARGSTAHTLRILKISCLKYFVKKILLKKYCCCWKVWNEAQSRVISPFLVAFLTNNRHMQVINATSRDCFLLFVQPSPRALSSKYEGDVFGISCTRDFASLAGWHSATLLSRHHSCGNSSQLLPALPPHPQRVTLGSLWEGITYFIPIINAFLICSLNIQDKLVLCLCYADTVFASPLPH